MIPRDASPIGHVPPLPRIDLTPTWKREAGVAPVTPFVSQAEQDRIWRLVKQTAEGTCGSVAPAPTETGIPATVDMSGWEAA